MAPAMVPGLAMTGRFPFQGEGDVAIPSKVAMAFQIGGHAITLNQYFTKCP